MEENIQKLKVLKIKWAFEMKWKIFFILLKATFKPMESMWKSSECWLKDMKSI